MLKVSEILRIKGNTLYTATPDTPIQAAIDTMSEQDIGSLVIMEHGQLAGMLTFREIIRYLHSSGVQWATTPYAASWTMPRSAFRPIPALKKCSASCWKNMRAIFR